MRTVFGLLLLFTTLHAVGQSKHHNTKKGFAINGYDVVSYFDGKAQEGNQAHTVEYEGVTYKFVSKENLETFNANPQKYLPKYGGFCAYAVAVAGKKVSVNPETFEIRDGELYLFYNSGKNNTLESWLAESPEELKQKADKNWEKILGK